MEKKQSKLSDKQEAFCNEYLVDLNATQAAIRAKYSFSTARQIGTENLAKPDIQARLAELMEDRSKRTEVTQDRVLLEIARLAFNDPRKAYDDSGKLLPVKQWPDEVAAAISGIKVREEKAEGEVIAELQEIKFWDKGKQIELAAKHLGMLTEQANLNLNVSGSVEVTGVLDKIKSRHEGK